MIRCKTCDTGQLERKKAFRMGGVVVVIGFILLIPSVFGMIVGGLLLFASLSQTSMEMASIQFEARRALEARAVPTAVVSKVVASQALTRSDSAGLSRDHLLAIEDARMSMAARLTGADIGASLEGGLSTVLIVASLVGGLLGWLLITRKTVLQCSHCGAVAAAS